MDGTVLIADDDRTIRTFLTQALTRAGCRVHATSSLTTLLRWVGEGMGDLVITDVVMPDGNGLEMLPKIAQDRPGLPVIVISAQNTIMTAIQAAEAEAFDYLPKPFDLPDLMKRSARALSQAPQKSADAAAGDGAGARPPALPLVGRSAPMQTLYRTIARVMNADLPILITGESGTGKSLIARAIHDLGECARQPFAVLNAGSGQDARSLPDIAATARGGTLLLDEISDFDMAMQARIVRILDNLPRPAARVIATSRANLRPAMAEGRLRDDLFYRLRGVSLTVPSLRERVDDIPLLAEHFLTFGQEQGATARTMGEAASEAARRYHWPGNVRQLEFAIRSLSLVRRGEAISREELDNAIGDPVLAPAPETAEPDRLGDAVERHLRRYFELLGNELPPPGLYQRILREMERPLIEILLDASGGNQARCAEILGINRNTLRKKITALDIRVTRRRQMM